MRSPDTPMTFAEISATAEVLFEDLRGYLVEQLDAAIAEAARRAHRHAGKVTVTMMPALEPKSGRMLLSASLTAKYPAPANIPVPAYMTRDGRLVADDPDQQVLPLEGMTSIPGGKA